MVDYARTCCAPGLVIDNAALDKYSFTRDVYVPVATKASQSEPLFRTMPIAAP